MVKVLGGFRFLVDALGVSLQFLNLLQMIQPMCGHLLQHLAYSDSLVVFRMECQFL